MALRREDKMILKKKMRRQDETKVAKVDKQFAREFAAIALQRFQKGKDKRYSPQLVQKKMLKHQLWPKIKADLEVADFINEI